MSTFKHESTPQCYLSELEPLAALGRCLAVGATPAMVPGLASTPIPRHFLAGPVARLRRPNHVPASNQILTKRHWWSGASLVSETSSVPFKSGQKWGKNVSWKWKRNDKMKWKSQLTFWSLDVGAIVSLFHVATHAISKWFLPRCKM